MNPALEGYTARVFANLAKKDRTRLASDVAAVVKVVGASEELTLALTDTGVNGPSRRAVMTELLEGKVSAPAARAIAFSVGAVKTSEVLAALSWLEHRSEHTEADELVDFHLLSRSQARQRVGGYAAAVFEELSNAQLSTVEAELFSFARVLEESAPLRAALGDRDLPASLRSGLIDDLLKGKVSPATLTLLSFVASGGRPRDIAGTVEFLIDQTATALGWRIARVQSAKALRVVDRKKLTDSLTKMAGAPVELQISLEGDLVSGVVVEIGDLLLDASIKRRLEELHEQLVPAGWQDEGFGLSATTKGAN